MSQCGNCGRPLSTRECADPVHRAAQGFTAGQDLPPGSRACIKCFRVKPQALFWNGKARTFYKTCNQCRYQARMQRPSRLRKRAWNRAEREDADAFWTRQASTHM